MPPSIPAAIPMKLFCNSYKNVIKNAILLMLYFGKFFANYLMNQQFFFAKSCNQPICRISSKYAQPYELHELRYCHIYLYSKQQQPLSGNFIHILLFVLQLKTHSKMCALCSTVESVKIVLPIAFFCCYNPNVLYEIFANNLNL